MGVILFAVNGSDVQVNWWNWRPTVGLLHRNGLLADEQAARCVSNGADGKLSEAEAVAVADFLDEVLGNLPADTALGLDGSRRTTIREPLTMPVTDEWYQASSEWLRQFAVFCRGSGGFRVS